MSHLYVGDLVDLRVTDATLEVYKGGERLATHPLFPAYVSNKYSTAGSHMPSKHGYQDWDAERIRAWAGRVGPACAGAIERVFLSVRFEEQGYNACLAILRLTHKYGAKRVEAACGMALASGVRSPRYGHINPILETNQDKIAAAAEADAGATGYMRGADYY